jgi:choline transport protein
LGWQTGTCIVAFLAGTEIQGLLALNYPSYVFERWHGTLLVIGIAGFSILFNTFFARRLPILEIIVLVLHLGGFFAILITLWVTTPEKNSSHTVFFTFYDGGNWGSIGFSCLIGMLSPVFSFIGT